MRRLLLYSTFIFFYLLIVNTKASACDQFASITVTKSGCTAIIQWSYTECALGNYYILYSTDGSNFYPIGQVSATGGAGGTYSYTWTDNNVVVNSSGITYYTIRYISPTNVSVLSIIKTLSATGCSTNMSSRCASLPTGLSMTGADAICSNTTQNYSLSTSYLATWSMSGGSNLVTSNIGTSYGTVGITNSTNTGEISLNANIFGCKNISKTIAIGPYIIGYYTISANSWGSPGVQYDLPGGASVILAKNDNALFDCHVTNSGLSNINWTWSGATPWGVVTGNNGLGLTFHMTVPSTSWTQSTTSWNVTANHTCGAINQTINFTVVANGSGFSVQKGNNNPIPSEKNSFSNLVNEENRLAIFPNPSKGDKLNIVLLTKSNLVKIKIVGISGNIFRQNIKNFTNTGIQSFDLDIHQYPAGSYILEVSDGKVISSKKFVKASN